MKHTDFIEKKRHGTPGFPIEYYCLDKNSPQYIMQPHWHKEFEIIRIREGSFEVHLNNTEFHPRCGDILLVEGGCLHRGQPTDCTYECLVFDPAMLKRQQNDAAEKYISPIVNSFFTIKNLVDMADSDVCAAVNSLFEVISAKEPYFELRIYGLLFELFSLLYKNEYITPSDKAMHSRRTQMMTDLIKWIEENLSRPISLDELAARAGVNSKYLCRLFKEYTSRTPIEYINELRIENACYEISVKGKNITGASYDSGFGDLSYFCKLFKRYKGMTPGEYKKEKCSRP